MAARPPPSSEWMFRRIQTRVTRRRAEERRGPEKEQKRNRGRRSQERLLGMRCCCSSVQCRADKGIGKRGARGRERESRLRDWIKAVFSS